jgi:septum formation protein
MNPQRVRPRSSSRTSELLSSSPQLILASGPPQRRAILEQLGVDFEVIVSGVDELESGPPEEVVLENAYRKAHAVAEGLAAGSLHAFGRYSAQNSTVLGVDTVVTLGGKVYGKPRDDADALETLRLLNGRTHRVLSGVCLIEGDRVRTAAAVTNVTFRRVDEEMLAWYLGTGEWEGRAGGYAIQGRGAALVAGIDGDYLNVVGLPVPTLLDLLPDLLQ